ncbi:MAG: TldD/PmbA family protein [Acidobacteria bacterium]|nr:TldD/PmbA family protein [Acidobacteriota bacterium]
MRRQILLRMGLSGLIFTLLVVISTGQAQEMPARLKIMKAELTRNFEALQKEQTPPYYMSYSVDEVRIQAVAGTFGAIIGQNDETTAYLQTSVRAGSYKLDSSHELRGDALRSLRSASQASVRAPLGESQEALAVILWRETDKAYRNAVETLSKVKSEQSVKIAEEDQSDDFSKVEPHVSIQKPLHIQVDMNKWAGRIRRFTAPFKDHAFIYNASGSFQSEVRQKYLVDSEGSVVSTPANYMRLSISATAKADDGMELPLYLSYFGFKESDLPSEAQVMSDIKTMIADLDKLRSAPIVDPYTGPAILAGRASGVFFHEILGHRLEGHRLKSESEGQTFKKKVGEQILPGFLSIIFDPTIRDLHGLVLSGAYGYDDEGTKAERVVTIENGVLKDFLMSRAPADRFPRSNGHARSQPGAQPVARQSNLIVESKNMIQEDELKQMLIDECKKQDKPFGLLFTEISGGYTSTGRSSPNAFNVTPLAVYRIYTDGRPDEMVRGVDLIGTPLTVFSKIAATGSKLEVFNGICGAESGSVPVSAVSPSILVSEIEVQKKAKSQEKPPILPPPAKSILAQNGGEL